jgi:hypothetical protein
MPTNLQKPGADPTDFPIVAVVDSGVSSKMPGLEEWVHKHLRFVAEEDENVYHGTRSSRVWYRLNATVQGNCGLPFALIIR